MSPPSDQRVLVGQIGAPHGLRGEVRIRAFTDDPQALADYGVLRSEDGRRDVRIRRLRPGKGALIATIEGVTTRSDAETLRNCRLYVSREVLPAPDEDEWYHADLIGLMARDRQGGEIGTVIAIHDFGAGDLLELDRSGTGGTAYVPFTRDVVPEVSIAGGYVIIEPPPGLLDRHEPDDPEDQPS